MCVTIGAGKTTTFSILTGERSPSQGTAYIAGYDVRTNLKKVYIQPIKPIL